MRTLFLVPKMFLLQHMFTVHACSLYPALLSSSSSNLSSLLRTSHTDSNILSTMTPPPTCVWYATYTYMYMYIGMFTQPSACLATTPHWVFLEVNDRGNLVADVCTCISCYMYFSFLAFVALNIIILCSSATSAGTRYSLQTCMCVLTLSPPSIPTLLPLILPPFQSPSSLCTRQHPKQSCNFYSSPCITSRDSACPAELPW